MVTKQRSNPDALPDAPTPSVGLYAVNGTHLHAEIRGDGPALLIIPGGGEDAEGWRPVAERLSDHLVITYDRRGTRRSGREDWPGRGSPQHADDAAALLAALGIDAAVVLGASSGGIIAVELALRHPELVRRALVFEPGYFSNIGAGAAIVRPFDEAVIPYLAEHPGDWSGAHLAFLRAVAGDDAATDAAILAGPPGKDWYTERERSNAEAALRDDIPILAREVLDEQRLASATADIRFSFGSESAELFRDIVSRLATIRGSVPDRVDGAGHSLYFSPDRVAAYVRELA